MRFSREVDLMLLMAATMAVVLGVTMIYSTGEGTLWKTQAGYAIFALLLAAAMIYVPDKILFEMAYPLYGVGLLALAAVLMWGTGASGRWLSLGPADSLKLQPSEFAKIATIMAMARYLGDCSSEDMDRPRPFFIALLICGVPMALVNAQPDLGTAISFGAPLLPLLYWAGMRPLHIFFVTAPLLSVVFSFEELWQEQSTLVFALFIIASSLAVQLLLARLWITLTLLGINLSAGLVTDYVWNNLILDHQRPRILTFLNPESDPLGAGWNLFQSKIAIGSGGLMGKGYLQGTQTRYEFLPAAHTDFIFAVIGEELGFLGAVVVLSLFLFMIWRSLYIGTMANNRFHSLLSIGLASILMFHVFINIGMTIGVMPITGLPLPFLSYGGSSLATNCIALGLLLHVYTNRHEY